MCLCLSLSVYLCVCLRLCVHPSGYRLPSIARLLWRMCILFWQHAVCVCVCVCVP